MGLQSVRARLLVLFASFSLILLSALALSTPLLSGMRSASAAPVHLAVAGPMLSVSPTTLTNCTQCTVTVTNQSAAKPLTWSAASRGISGVAIQPAHGTLPPKKQGTVNITMPANITCPANDTIIFSGPANMVKVSWSCTPTPTPTPSPTPATPIPTPTTALTLSPTPSASPAQTGNTTPTPTVTSVANSGSSGGQNNNGNPPTSTTGSGSPGSSAPSIILSVAALLLALLAFTLYLMAPVGTSLSSRLLALILPTSFLKRPGQNRR
jgi:hypothetical protein